MIYIKRWLVFLLLIFIFILLIINVYKKDKKNIVIEKNLTEKEIEDYSEISGITINVLIKSTGEVIAMDLNEYLRGVVPSEMPPSYDIEALKAQAVVARTYTLKKITDNAHREDNVDICDSYAHCQAYYSDEKLREIWMRKGFDEQTITNNFNKVNIAVSTTTNKVITYNGEYIKAFFHASSPIKTEDVKEIWGNIQIPYLKSVSNVESDDYKNRYSRVEIDIHNFQNKIKSKIDNRYIYNKNVDIKINEYTDSNRVKSISVNGTIINAEKLRTIFGLKSTLFDIEIVDNKVVFNVTGYGHGVGMSQVGANYLALNNKSYIDIIKYYYQGVEVTNIENTKKG